jgi:hypothetical protein
MGRNRALYRTLWVFEVLAIVGFVLALALPIQDCALREYFQWQKHPSPETYKAFLEKHQQERAMRLLIAVPFAGAAMLLTGPLRKYRLGFLAGSSIIRHLLGPSIAKPLKGSGKCLRSVPVCTFVRHGDVDTSRGQRLVPKFALDGLPAAHPAPRG